MRKKFLFLLICLPFLFCSCVNANYDYPETVTVFILLGNEKRTCSGIVCEKGILTVAHIFRGLYEEKLICSFLDMNGNTYEAENIFADFDDDVALIEYKSSKKPLKMTNFDDILFVKNNDIFQKSTDNKMVKSKVPNKPNDLIRLKITVCDGTSGSAVTDENGRLAGMICGRSPDGEYAYAVPSRIIDKFLKNYR